MSHPCYLFDRGIVAEGFHEKKDCNQYLFAHQPPFSVAEGFHEKKDCNHRFHRIHSLLCAVAEGFHEKKDCNFPQSFFSGKKFVVAEGSTKKGLQRQYRKNGVTPFIVRCRRVPRKKGLQQ